MSAATANGQGGLEGLEPTAADVMTQSTTSSLFADNSSASAGPDLASSQPTPQRQQQPSSHATSSLDSKKFFSGSYGVRLARFFIFNSSFGPKEGEEAKKIIFFHDNTVTSKVNGEVNDLMVQGQTKQVGLIEAVIRFSATFAKDQKSSSKTLHTLKTKSLAWEAEDGFVMVITATVPKTKRRKKGTGAGSSANTYECTYSPDALHENALESVLKRAFEMFTMFMGGFEHQLKVECGGDLAAFKARVKAFFSSYVHSLRSLEKADLAGNLFNGVRFQTLESQAFLKVHSFVDRIRDEFRSQVANSMFFHQGNIVWSGMQQKETALLYQYINNTLLPHSAMLMTSSTSPVSPMTSSSPTGPFAGHQGKFLTGQSVLMTSSAKSDIPRLFLPTGEKHGMPEEFQLLVYHAIMSTVCLIVPISVKIDADLLHALDGHMGTALTNMSADLLDVFGAVGRQGSADQQQLMLVPNQAAIQEATPVMSSSGGGGGRPAAGASGGFSLVSSSSVSSLKDVASSAASGTNSGTNSGLDLTSLPAAATDGSVKMVYFNETNLAMKNTLVMANGSIPQWTGNGSGSGGGDFKPEVANFQEATHMIAELNADFAKLNRCSSGGSEVATSAANRKPGGACDDGSELCVRLSSDQWVVGKKVDSRQVYFVVTIKNSYILEVMELVNKVASVEFRNVCLLDK